MPRNNSNSPKRKKNRPLAKIQKKLGRVKKRACRLDEDIDDIYQELDDLVNGPDSSPVRRGSPSSSLPAGVPATNNLELQRLAKVGVASLSLTFLDNGSGSLKIDGHARIPLPPRLAALTASLVVDTGQSPDHLVSWKSDVEIIADLKQRIGKNYSRHAFNHLMHLLRATFKDHSENPWLIMRDPKFGSRFALRRTLGNNVIAAGHN